MLMSNHLDNNNNVHMVDISDKQISTRVAVATGKISMKRDTIISILNDTVSKGNVLCTSRIAGIMAVKNTPNIIPLCHSLFISASSIEFCIDEQSSIITALCKVKTDAKTGLEMEALNGVMVSLLTIYDMCKGIDKTMIITDIHLLSKSGGRSGNFEFGEYLKDDGSI